ncbi:putative cytochrome P450 [Helianthus anomalus]
MNVWKLHRDPQVWSDPHEFRPERFLKEHSEINYSGQNFEYIPFSTGRRMCPATMFASNVLHLTFARLLQGFDLSTPMGKPVDMSEGLGLTLPKAEPLEVTITPRLSPELY